MLWGVHAYPDTVYLLQFVIIGSRKFSVQLLRQHPCTIEDSSGNNVVFLIKFLLRFHIKQQLYRGRLTLPGKQGAEPDVIGEASLSGDLAFRVVTCD